MLYPDLTLTRLYRGTRADGKRILSSSCCNVCRRNSCLNYQLNRHDETCTVADRCKSENTEKQAAKIQFVDVTIAEETYLMLKSTLWKEVNPCLGRDWVGLKILAVLLPDQHIL